MLSRRIHCKHSVNELQTQSAKPKEVNEASDNKDEPFSKNINVFIEGIKDLKDKVDLIKLGPAGYMFNNNLETKDVKEVFKLIQSAPPLTGDAVKQYVELTDELAFEQICQRYEFDPQTVRRRIGKETMHTPTDMVTDMNKHLDKTAFVYRVLYSDVTDAYPLFFDELAANFEHFNISWPDVDLPTYEGDIWLYLVLHGKRRFERGVFYDPTLDIVSKSKPIIIDLYMGVAADAVYALALCSSLNGDGKPSKSRTVKVSPENEYCIRLDRIKSKLAQIVKRAKVKRTHQTHAVDHDDEDDSFDDLSPW